MFLFEKKTRNVIKYMWGFFAILIVLSMVIAYSGFASLAQTTPTGEPIEIPAEVRAQLEAQRAGEDIGNISNTLEEQEVLRAINEGRIDLDPENIATGTSETPDTPKAPELKLEI